MQAAVVLERPRRDVRQRDPQVPALGQHGRLRSVLLLLEGRLAADELEAKSRGAAPIGNSTLGQSDHGRFTSDRYAYEGGRTKRHGGDITEVLAKVNDCVPGKFASTAGQDKCQKCADHFYAWKRGSSACISCASTLPCRDKTSAK